VVNSQCFYVEYLIGLRVKTALISAVYKKSTKLSNTGRKEMTGKATNLQICPKRTVEVRKLSYVTLWKVVITC
jgi:hypothetical protein